MARAPGRPDKRYFLALGALAVALLAWTLLSGAVLLLGLDEAQRAEVLRLVGGRLGLVVLLGLMVVGAAAFGLRVLYDRYIAAPARLAEQARLCLESEDLPGGWQAALSPELQAIAGAVADLVAQRSAVRQSMDARVAQASRAIDEERSRLAALMSELSQSVVVCNLDGRVLLYNNRARLQFRALSRAPRQSGGSELIGIGRSIYGVLDRQQLAHGLDSLRQRMARGATQPSTQFVTPTRAGQLLRVHMAPVRLGAAPTAAPTDLSGFVLMLENITTEFEAESVRDRLLHSLSEGNRGSLANAQMAMEMLQLPDLTPPMREHFLDVVRDEIRGMVERLRHAAVHSADALRSRWPLEEMQGADLLHVAAGRVAAQGGLTASTVEPVPELWLRVESFSLIQALCYLGSRLAQEFNVRHVQLRLTPGGESEARAQLDLIWTGQAMSTETVMGWEMDAMQWGEERSPLSVRDVVERHGGAFWFERERTRHQAFFRFLLPLAAEPEESLPQAYLRSDSRPEYYDFDLFERSETDTALDERPLSALAYTVFDTETTGLNPADGDEIIQIGAARVVNGRVLQQECFDQLVDPRRNIPAASIPIHGITADMVQGQPTIDEVLPTFHAYAQDTVLVAHNAAFDMRFLQIKERQTGVAFRQPVLDTLLLSALVHPNQESHRLEALAERFRVPVIGRHTALGDAIVTAEVFVRLIPLLQAQGIHTLGQAREAAQRTYYARIKY